MSINYHALAFKDGEDYIWVYYMNPHENRSKSFQIFVQGLREIIKN